MCVCVCVRVRACVRVCVCASVLEMQQYIDISPYHDTLGSDTVSIGCIDMYIELS